MTKDNEKLIQPIQGAFDEVADALLQSNKNITSKNPDGLVATHKGNFYEDFGIDIDCYVLDDEDKTAVISQRGMAQALGLSARGSAFPRFASSKFMTEYAGSETLQKIENPLRFQAGSGGAEQPRSIVNGYDVTLLIDVCKTIIQAADNGELSSRYDPVIKQAKVIINASAKSGIQNLVYKLAGFDATKEQAIAAFKRFVRQEAREYEKEFPDQLYDEWYRLYQYPKPERNKPWKFKHLTIDHVYRPLAKSNGKILQLTQVQRSQKEERHKRLHQFLSEIGVKALRNQLGQLLGIARISKSQEEYERHVKTLFDDQLDLLDSSPHKE